MTAREMIYLREREMLAENAAFTQNTKGRLVPIVEDDLRSEFQRDRDRIIHSKAFRRLMHKTQVFLSPEVDHYRTRLTHTLEVMQIARTIARALRLNEDLCEAIALGHDLGHTPFGHAGERVLQRCFDPDYTHYKQSLRVVDFLERLNLTHEVRDGILCHTTGGAETLEGRIIWYADRIAYINHDIDDACRAGILSPDSIPEKVRRVLGNTHSERIGTMVKSIVEESPRCGDIVMGDEVGEATKQLHEFLYENVYFNPIAKGEEGKAEAMLETLYDYFVRHPEKMPSEYIEIAEKEGVPRAAADYISGMTDRYAINQYKRLFIPEPFRG
jgi:dGTPase